MKVEMFESAESLVGRKKDRGPGPRSELQAFVDDTSKAAMTITCESADTAHSVNCSARAIIKKEGWAIKTWRTKNVVCFEKEDNNEHKGM